MTKQDKVYEHLDQTSVSLKLLLEEIIKNISFNCSSFLFLRDLFIHFCLFERQREKRRERIFRQLVHFSSGHCGQGWGRMKQRARSCIQLSHVSAVAQEFEPSSTTFSGTFAGSWTINGTAKTWTGTQIAYWCCRQRFTLLHHSAGPGSLLFRIDSPLLLPQQWTNLMSGSLNINSVNGRLNEDVELNGHTGVNQVGLVPWQNPGVVIESGRDCGNMARTMEWGRNCD